MNIHEYQGKQLFAEHGILVQHGIHVTTTEGAGQAWDELGVGLVAVKSQIHAGGRGVCAEPEGYLTCPRGSGVSVTADILHYGARGPPCVVDVALFPSSQGQHEPAHMDSPQPGARRLLHGSEGGGCHGSMSGAC